ncbi:uncharacterized protein B4U79_16236 [Dinothrombium tinctorium]|uniref:Myb-like domain-containing protein n=1 Tax=Dinothrombium tinctorium TaxID=1965070 RepID=A0A3S3P1S5_9ACAR|nr:uncharacterized protein B4U79_16248 [Dinothrombium tinctorium]RWS06220.1 uncharacterized protein B4U79_16236 [Dinothrombium tinctorium]
MMLVQRRHLILCDKFRNWALVPKRTRKFKFNESAVKPIEVFQTTKEQVQTPNSANSKTNIVFTEEENGFVVEGALKYGLDWKYIKSSYNFQPQRTEQQIAQQYYKLKETRLDYFNTKIVKLPFASFEDRRLLKGVEKYGLNWEKILNSNLFAQSRTVQDLEERWKFLHCL